MKKFGIAVVLLAVFAIFVGGIVFVFSKMEKTPITVDYFESFMEEKGYTVVNDSSEFSNYDYLKRVYLAISDDYSFQIEFYELVDEEYAIKFFENNMAIFKSSKESNSLESTVNLMNASKYTLSCNNKYKVISRIDNTVIYLDVDDEYTETVKSVLSELGY